MHKVLLVEDEEAIRENLAEIFELNNFKVFTAMDGKEALRVAIERLPDLIISDVIMPNMDGFEFLEKVKNNNLTLNIPVILLTAKTMHESKLQGLKTGADDYLTKPFDTEELLIRANNIINSRKRLTHGIELVPDNQRVESKDEFFMKRVMRIIDRNIDRVDFEIDDFVKDLGYSRSSIQKKVKSLTGKTTSTLIRDYRLERGRQLIEQNAGNLSEIASMVGFNSLSYFSNCYKTYFGVSPLKNRTAKKLGVDITKHMIQRDNPS